MMRWFRRDPPDRELTTQMRELWHASERRATPCRDRKTGEAWDKPDGRERLTHVVKVLATVLPMRRAG